MNTERFRMLSGWVDYDRPILIQNKLTKNQKILYFHKRLKMVLIIPIREIYKSLSRRKKYSSTVLCFGTCICCALEALGKFYTGKTSRGNSRTNFIAFVDKYMDHRFLQILHDVTYLDLLRENFRNGLAHGFTIKNGGFEFQRSYFQIKTIGAIDKLEIDPEHFYNDFTRAVSKYIRDLKAASSTQPISVNFEKAFQDIFIRGI